MPLTNSQKSKAKDVAAELSALSTKEFRRWKDHQKIEAEWEMLSPPLERYSKKLQEVITYTTQLEEASEDLEFWYEVMLECKEKADYLTLISIWNCVKNRANPSGDNYKDLYAKLENLFSETKGFKKLIEQIAQDSLNDKFPTIPYLLLASSEGIEKRIQNAMNLLPMASSELGAENKHDNDTKEERKDESAAVNVKPEIKEEKEKPKATPAASTAQNYLPVIAKHQPIRLKNLTNYLRKNVPYFKYDKKIQLIIEDLPAQYKKSFRWSLSSARSKDLDIIKNFINDKNNDHEEALLTAYLFAYVENKDGHSAVLPGLLSKYIFDLHPWIKDCPPISGKYLHEGDRILKYAGDNYPGLAVEVYNRIHGILHREMTAKNAKKIDKDVREALISETESEYMNSVKLLRRMGASELCCSPGGVISPSEKQIAIQHDDCVDKALKSDDHDWHPKSDWAVNRTKFCKKRGILEKQQKSEQDLQKATLDDKHFQYNAR